MRKTDDQNDDIVFENETESFSNDFEKKILKLKEELKKCKEEKEQFLDGWQRSKADFINYKKRSGDDLTTFRKYANEDLILSIIPVLDSFEMSLRDHGESEEIKKWKIGFEQIYKQIKKILENNNVEQLNPENEIFDPKIHESIEMKETDDKELDHKIYEVVMRGYKLGDKILRAPQVKIWVLKH